MILMLLLMAYSQDNHLLCSKSCYLIQLRDIKINENLIYFLSCLGISLWQSLKNVNSVLTKSDPEFYWRNANLTYHLLYRWVMITAHVFILKCIIYHQTISIILCKSLTFKQSLWKAVTKPQHRATDADKPHVRSQHFR